MSQPIQMPTQQDDEQQQSLMPFGQPMFPVNPADRPNFALGAAARAPMNTASPIVKAAAAGSPNVRPTPPAIDSDAASAGNPPILLPTQQTPPPPTLKSGPERLWEKAGSVRNPFARFLAETGAGVLRAGDVAAEGLAPRFAMLAPGSELNTSIRNAANRRNWEKQQTMQVNQQNADSAGLRANAESERADAEERKAMQVPPVKQDWEPVTGTGYELNRDSGETRPMPGVTVQPKRFTNPFEAYTYGSPTERQSAEDFISFERKQGARYEKPGEVEQRYALYKRDPEAYKAMFGDRGAAQDATQSARDQAQATRMLNYFDRQRRAIQDDFTLDDNEKQQKLSEIDSLEQPYLNIAQPGGNASAAQPANAGPRNNAPQYKAGDEVTYKGQRMKILRILPSGKLELQAIGAQ